MHPKFNPMIVFPVRRKLIVFAVLAGASLIAFVLALPWLFNIDRYRPKVIAYLEEKLGNRVEIDRLTLDFFPLSLGIENLNVKNPDDFPSGDIVKIGRIRADLDPRGLWHRQVIIRSLILTHPVPSISFLMRAACGTSKTRGQKARSEHSPSA